MSDFVKKILAGLTGAILLAPLLAYATPTSINRIVDHLEPLITTDFIKAQFFTATSTTNHSTFPYASSTALTAGNLFATNLTLTNALTAANGGTASTTLGGILAGNGASGVKSALLSGLTWDGTTLTSTASGGGTGVATTSLLGTYPTILTKTAASITFSDAAGTTTVNVCASGCPFSSIQSALTAGFKTLNLAPETYTLATPVTLSQNKITIIGAGPNTILACNTSSIPTCLLSTTALSSINVRDLTISNTGSSGTGTCIDFTQMGASEFSSVDCTGNFQIGYIASTTNDTSYNVIRQPVINVAGTGGYGIYLGAHAINNTIEYPRINPNGDDRVVGLYLDGSNTFCIHCETEKYAGIGLEVGSDARSMDLNVYQELNKTNIQIDKDAYAINITGFSGDASSTAQNLSDLGARGLSVAGNMGYRPTYYLNNINWGIGTSTPFGMLSINDWPGSSSTLPFIISSSTASATTTLFSVDNTGAIDTVLASGCVQVNGSGVFTSTGVNCGTGSSGGSDFNFGTLTFSTTTAATTTSIWLNGGSFFSSSTVASQLPYASTTAITIGNASTTNLNVSGATTLQSLVTGANRFLFITTTGVISSVGFPLSEPNGGTNSGTLFGANSIIVQNAANNALTSTSSQPLYVGSIFATTTLTSTLPYASSTYSSFIGASSTKYFGAGLDAGCNGTSFLQITSGTFGCGTPSGSAASAFEVATTSDIAISQLAYINKTSGRTTLASVATTTLTGTAPITFSQPISVIGGSSSVITCAVATASVPGCLAAADFTTFAAKLSSYDAFTHTSYQGQTTSATTATMWFTGATVSLAASSSQLTYASSTAITAATLYSTTALGAATSTITGGLRVGTTTETFGANTAVQIISNGAQAVGNLLLTTATNVVNAFRITNSAGTTVFNVDTTATNAQWAVGTSTFGNSEVTIFAPTGQTLVNLFQIASTTGNATSSLFTVDNQGNIITKGASPILGACGTATLSATSTDMRGTITVTAGTPTACTMTFSNAKTDTPTCIGDGPSSALGAVGITAASSSGVLFNLAAVFSGSFRYICLQ